MEKVVEIQVSSDPFPLYFFDAKLNIPTYPVLGESDTSDLVDVKIDLRVRNGPFR